MIQDNVDLIKDNLMLKKTLKEQERKVQSLIRKMNNVNISMICMVESVMSNSTFVKRMPTHFQSQQIFVQVQTISEQIILQS